MGLLRCNYLPDWFPDSVDRERPGFAAMFRRFHSFGRRDRPEKNGPLVTETPRNVQTINGQTGNYWFNPNSFVPGSAWNNWKCLTRLFPWSWDQQLELLVLQEHIDDLERLRLQLRLDAFNIFNHTQFAGPAQPGTAAAGDNANNVNAGDFGQILATQEDARILQISAHLNF